MRRLLFVLLLTYIQQNISANSQQIVQVIENKVETESNTTFCETCHNVIKTIVDFRKSRADKDTFAALLWQLCLKYTDWGQEACYGYISIEIDTVSYIIDNKDLTPQKVCSIAFQHKKCVDPSENQWEIKIPPLSSTPKFQQNFSPHHLKILHLTDIHYDPLYKAGNDAKCNLPLCCQITNGAPNNPLNAAGYWGDYNVCDMPWYSITELMTHLNNTYKNFDFIYYTGDIISHKSWATSKDHNVGSIKAIYKLFKNSFGNIPVFPILGNHEPHPTDFYSPGNVTHNPKVTTQWVFNLVAEEWSRWLPKTTKSTILNGGYYTFLAKPGFRIIGLNSNVCFTSNLWLLYQDKDPYDQLKWLVETLAEAEKNGENVHILSHIPPGENTCLKQWNRQFKRIITRFSAIISGQFNGHTHYDEIRIFYNENRTKVINAAYNAGSFTTFVGLNPNYRIYDINSENYTVTDYEHFTYNLTKANKDKSEPNWYKLYSFKEAYGLPNLNWENLADFVEKIRKSPQLQQQYFRFLVRESDAKISEGCDENCAKELVCSITAIDFEESIQCERETRNV